MARQKAEEEQDPRTLDELQREIAKVELRDKQLKLKQTQRSLDEYEEAERRRHLANQQRMDELKSAQQQRFAVIRNCKHKSGGSPHKIHRGGGKNAFSIITRAKMPDGVTILLQCSRCRLMMYTPETGKRQLWFKTYAQELEYYEKLMDTSVEDGIENCETGGPTFLFKKNGVPFIPERV
jgi:hypothetical protein